MTDPEQVAAAYFTPTEIPPAAEPAPWRARGCTVGLDRDRCGHAIVGAVMVSVAADAWDLDEQRHGLLLLCRHHYAGLTAPQEAPCPPSSASPPSPPP